MFQQSRFQKLGKGEESRTNPDKNGDYTINTYPVRESNPGEFTHKVPMRCLDIKLSLETDSKCACRMLHYAAPNGLVATLR